MKAALAELTTFSVARPIWICGVFLVLVLGSAMGVATSLRIDTDTARLIADTVPYRTNAIAFREAFPLRADPLLIVVDGPTGGLTEVAADRLADAMRATPGFSRVERPDADPFLRRHALLYLHVDALNELSKALVEAQPLLATLNAAPGLAGLADMLGLALDPRGGEPREQLISFIRALADTAEARLNGTPAPFDAGSLFSMHDPLDGKRFITADVEIDHGRLGGRREMLDKVRALAEENGVTEGHGYNVRLTGKPALSVEQIRSIESGMGLAGVLSLILVALLLIAALRSGRLILAVLLVLMAGLFVTAGLAAIFIGTLNLISVAFAVLFIGLGVDSGIHFALRYRAIAAGGVPTEQALTEATRQVGPAMTLAALCAIIGFLSFLPTDYRGMAELGAIAAAGMAVSLMANLSLLPSLITLMRPLVPRPLSSRETDGRVEAALHRRSGIFRGAGILITIAATIAAVAGSRFDLNPLNLQDPDAEAVRTYRALADNPVTTPYTIEVIAADLKAADQMAARLTALPEVGSARTLNSMIPADQEDKLAILDDLVLLLGPALDPPGRAPEETARRDALDRLILALDDAPLSAAEASHRLAGALHHPANRSPEALRQIEFDLTTDLMHRLATLRTAILEAGPIDLAGLPERLSQQWIASDGRARIRVSPAPSMENDSEGFRAFADAVLAVAPEATGAPVQISQGARTVIRAFVESTVLTAILLIGVLAVMQRRLRDVVLTLGSVVIAAIWTFGIAAVLGLAINFANVIVLPLLFGLGVSSAIHMVARAREDTGDHGPEIASSTPRAIVYSALTTVASFGSLALSPHPGTASMGMMLAIAISSTLAVTLFLLPALTSGWPAQDRK